jgi:hypothetical protein
MIFGFNRETAYDATELRKPGLNSSPWLGCRTHAADRMAPDAFPTVHLAKAMVQENIGRARRVGARIIADDTVAAEGGLDRRAFELSCSGICSISSRLLPAISSTAGKITPGSARI